MGTDKDQTSGDQILQRRNAGKGEIGRISLRFHALYSAFRVVSVCAATSTMTVTTVHYFHLPFIKNYESVQDTRRNKGILTVRMEKGQ